MSTDAPTPERPNFDSGLTDEETAAVVASARQTPERVTLSDEEEALAVAVARGSNRMLGESEQWVRRILAAREQALREGIREAKAEAWDEGRRAEHRDWVLVFDLSTPDEDRQPWPNPYRDQTEETTR